MGGLYTRFLTKSLRPAWPQAAPRCASTRCRSRWCPAYRDSRMNCRSGCTRPPSRPERRSGPDAQGSGRGNLRGNHPIWYHLCNYKKTDSAFALGNLVDFCDWSDWTGWIFSAIQPVTNSGNYEYLTVSREHTVFTSFNWLFIWLWYSLVWLAICGRVYARNA